MFLSKKRKKAPYTLKKGIFKQPRKPKVTLSELEKVALQESYRLTRAHLPELRIALSPLFPRLGLTEKEFKKEITKSLKHEFIKNKIREMAKNPTRKRLKQLEREFKNNSELQEEIINQTNNRWSTCSHDKVTNRTLDHILKPLPLKNDKDTWLNQQESYYLQDKQGYIIIYQNEKSFDIYYRSNPYGQTEHVLCESDSLQKLEETVGEIQSQITKENNIDPQSIHYEEIPMGNDCLIRRTANTSESFLNCFVVHAVKINFFRKDSSDCILIILDRATRIVKMRYFNNLTETDIINVIQRFQNKFVNKLNLKPRKIHFITKDFGNKTTALSLTKEEMICLFENNNLPTAGLELEPTITFQNEMPLKAGYLKKLVKVQGRLVYFQNLYNLGFKRRYTQPFMAIMKECEQACKASNGDINQRNLSEVKKLLKASFKQKKR